MPQAKNKLATAKAATVAPKAEKPVIIKKIVTTIEQDKHGVQKRTTTTYNAPKAAGKKPAAKPATKSAPKSGKK